MGRSARGLYQPYRALGLVCDGAEGGACAPTLLRQGTTTSLITPVDGARTLHLYDTDLHLKGVSKPIPRSWARRTEEPRILAIAACHEFTFAAIGQNIGVFLRMRPFTLWKGHDEPVSFMRAVADLLISVSSEERRLIAWGLPSSGRDEPSKNGNIVADIVLPPRFEPTCVAHPQTYVNKVLLGAKDGRCLLLNLRSKSVVHMFEGFSSPVSVLEPSPVLDVVAVGTEDGLVHLHNFRADETVLTVRHNTDVNASEKVDGDMSDARHSVTTVAFRSDGDQSMVTGDSGGNFVVWDLNEKRVRSEVCGVHIGGSSLSQFLPGEPILITAGFADNAIKVHIFDDINGNARILRSREGHHLPPTIVRFCGYGGSMMVSAGLDRELRLVSGVQDARNRSFAQASFDKKGSRAKKRRRIDEKAEKGDSRADICKRLPPVVALASNNMRQRDGDFANIVTVHADLSDAYTWRLQNGATHRHVLSPPEGPIQLGLAFKRGPRKERSSKAKPRTKIEEDKCATCVVLSPCGNYAIVGYKNGRIHSYNLQSGRHQGVYSDASVRTRQASGNAAAGKLPEGTWGCAHKGSIVGLTSDGCGDVLVSGGADDRKLKFWVLHTRELNGDAIETSANIIQLAWCRSSDLLAVSCDNFSVYIYDASTRMLARRFAGHQAPVVDMCFDPHGRRILSASMDSTIKTWDVPSGRNIDTLVCPEAPTSVAVAPGGDYLATTHVNSLGIGLWIDKSKYGSLQLGDPKNKNLTGLPSQTGSNVDDDYISSDDEEATEDAPSDNSDDSMSLVESDEKDEKSGAVVPTPLSGNVATLSSKPLTDWTTLSNLQAIRERNKPIEPTKKPQDAPFFLPTVKGLQLEFKVDQTEGTQESERRSQKSSRKMSNSDDEGDVEASDDWANSEFGRLVAKEQYESAGLLLSKLGASGVDVELRTLEGTQARRNAAVFFKERLSSPQEFELTQAHLAVFLAAHGTSLAKDEGGIGLIGELAAAQETAWEALRSKFDSVLTLSAYFAGQV